MRFFISKGRSDIPDRKRMERKIWGKTMKVIALIELLQTFPPDAECCLLSSEKTDDDVEKTIYISASEDNTKIYFESF